MRARQLLEGPPARIRCVAAGLVALVAVLACQTAHAQVPFAAGTYERWGSLFDAPSAPLPVARASLLPEWITVEVRGHTAVVTFEPERRVVWRIRYGPHGADHKRVLVDGVNVLDVVYERDASGHLVRKTARGALAPSGLVFAYRTDAQGRVISRERQLDASSTERLEVRWGPRATVARLLVGGVERRVDRWDAAGRLRSTTFAFESQVWGASPPRAIRSESRLVYVRERTGELREIRRRRGTQPETAADHRSRDATLAAEDLRVMTPAAFDRAEARLLFGAPESLVDRGRGPSREISETFGAGCWLNEVNILVFDPTGLYREGREGCICGFCVDAAAPFVATEVLGTELHVRRGPWLRLDGELVITADHRVLTPSGPRRAGELRAGDEVLGADGEVIHLQSVEPLPDTERLGRNVETASGTFVVGRFVVVSEPYEGPRTSCAEPP